VEPEGRVLVRRRRRLEAVGRPVHERGEIVLAGLRSPTHDEHVPEERELAASSPERPPERRRRDDRAGAAVRQQEGLLVGRDGEAHGDGHRPDLDGAEEGGHELGSVGQENGDALLDLDAQRGERVADLVRPSLHPRVGDAPPLVDVGEPFPVPGGDRAVDVLRGDVQHARHVDLRRRAHGRSAHRSSLLSLHGHSPGAPALIPRYRGSGA
jgi:hypothetical protein